MWNVDLYSNLKEISGITATVKNSDWRSNNLAEIVGNGKVVSCLTVGICTSRMSQPLDVVDIEVIKNSNLGFWILLENSINPFRNNFKDFPITRRSKYAHKKKRRKVVFLSGAKKARYSIHTFYFHTLKDFSRLREDLS